MHASTLLFMTWPLVGAAHGVLTVWNVRRFQAAAPAAPAQESTEAAAPGPVALGGGPPPAAVSVVVPARNEASRLPACLAGLLAQDLPGVEILVVDDGSTDGTAEAARQAAGDEVRVRVVTAPEPETGWSGKAWACAKGFEEARGARLVFLDADVVLAPGALHAALTQAEALAADMLVWSPRLAGGPPLQALLSPLSQSLALAGLPLDVVEGHPDARLAWPFGACLVLDRGAYQRAGGHAAKPGAAVPALALSQALKGSGGRVVVRDAGPGTIQVAATEPALLLEDLKRSLYPTFGGNAGPFVAALALVALLYVLPPLAALTGLLAGWPGLAAAGLLQTLLTIAGRAWQANRLGQAPWTAVLAPLAASAWLALALGSYAAWRKGGVTWKERPLPTPVAPKSAAR